MESPAPARRSLRTDRIAVLGVGLLLAALIGGVIGRVTAPDGAPASTTIGEGPTTTRPGDVVVPATDVSGNLGEDPQASEESATALVGVKVDNAPAARPQVGLALAPIIIEIPVEGGITRFVALYGPNRPDLVGPVRSLRPVDASLLPVFTDVIATSGGNAWVVAEVRGSGVVPFGPESGLLETVDRPPPHATFAALTAFPDGSRHTPLASGDTGLDTALSDGPVIPFSSANTVEWRWDGSRYVRWVDGDTHDVLDRLDGSPTPLTRDWVVVLFAAERSAGYTDSAGADVPTFDVVGGGRMLLFAGGTVTGGTWSRAAHDRPYVFRNASGDPLELPDGSVAITVVPEGLDVGS